MSVPRLAGGLPFIGHAIDFHKNPVDLLRRGRELHGELFSFSLAGKTVYVLTDPSGNEAVFRASDDQLSAREAYQFTVPMFGKGVAYDAPPEIMDEQIGFLIPGLRDARMQTYAQAIEEETEDYCAGWGEHGEFELADAMNELTVFNACRCLIGREFRRHLSTPFAHSYHDLEAGVNLVAFFRPGWPLPAMRRRDRGRTNIVRLISGVLDERRRRLPADDDFVDTLIAARYANGRALSDDEIVGLLLTLIFAGQHTSAVMAAWTACGASWWTAWIIFCACGLNDAHSERNFSAPGPFQKDSLWLTALSILLIACCRSAPPVAKFCFSCWPMARSIPTMPEAIGSDPSVCAQGRASVDSGPLPMSRKTRQICTCPASRMTSLLTRPLVLRLLLMYFK